MLCVSASIHWVHNTKQQPCLNRPSEFNNTHTTRSVRCSSRHHALCTMHHAPCSMHHAPCIMQHAPCQHRTRSVRCSSRHHVQALASEAHTAVCDGSGACDCVRGPAYEKRRGERSELELRLCRYQKCQHGWGPWLQFCMIVRCDYRLQGVDHEQGWPEPYVHTVYDRIFGDFPATCTVYAPYI